ncbi:MAG: N-acetyl-gamma-glutamyl-phosphate reductase [Alphaproteobacteria bacterium]|nr:N-acetyl-gamma-glutamyl-phosphate reductase [Alphaproteobacteria bacterium]
MSKAKIFIDGAAGTTGLEIRERLSARPELELLTLSETQRKDAAARKAMLNAADLVILCLPDEAAKEAVALIDNPAVKVVDASTAHRIAPGWTYGFAELEADGATKIAAAKRVSNPGCWATGFLAIARPLVRAAILPPDYPLTVHGVSGYSGGGKSMIEEFQKTDAPHYVETVQRAYALGLAHKHIPEMTQHAGLTRAPLFSPNVARFYRGMLVEVPLQLWSLPGAPRITDLHAALTDAYAGKALVSVAGLAEAAEMKVLDAELLSGTNLMKLFVFGNEKAGQARVVAAFDNLGKGAGGAAVQNMNLMLGLPETSGLLD